MQTPGAPLDDEDALLLDEEEELLDEALLELLDEELLDEALLAEELLEEDEAPPDPEVVVVLDVFPPLPSGTGALCAQPVTIAAIVAIVKGTTTGSMATRLARRATEEGRSIARDIVRGARVRQWRGAIPSMETWRNGAMKP